MRPTTPSSGHGAGLVADLHRHPGHRDAHARQGAGARADLARVRELHRVHRHRPERAARRGEGDRERRLGQAVDRHQRRGTEAPPGEALGEAPRRVHRDLLGAVEREPPAGEVHPLHLLVLHPPGADRVGEAGRDGDGPLVARERAQPQRRPSEEHLGPEQHQRPGVGHGAEQTADEPHVVVQRQPAHAELRILRSVVRHQRPERVDLGEHRAVRQRHRLRVHRAPRRELHQRERARVGRAGDRWRARLAQRGHVPEPEPRGPATHRLSEEPSHPPVGEQRHRARRAGACARSTRGTPAGGRAAPAGRAAPEPRRRGASRRTRP